MTSLKYRRLHPLKFTLLEPGFEASSSSSSSSSSYAAAAAGLETSVAWLYSVFLRLRDLLFSAATAVWRGVKSFGSTIIEVNKNAYSSYLCGWKDESSTKR